MAEKALSLLQKGRSMPEAGRWRGIAEVGLLRLLYRSGQYAQVLAEYKRGQDQIPEEVRAEMMLIVGNSERQLGHTKEADDVYRQIIAKYPNREEAKDAQYQRLINIYNSNAPTLLAEVDEFLKSNPTPERADQAKLLKAEPFYKEQKFADAAPIYAELRASHLSPKLRAEAAYKLAWCFVQLKDGPQVIEAFTYFLKAFPDNPQVPSALTQRALAYQESKNYSAAIEDLNTLLAKFPTAKEREAALQQKALLIGQQENSKGMTEAFQQLLKEYPKSSVAAQAHYYIGKAAFEAKDYKAAMAALDSSRKLNKEQYYIPPRSGSSPRISTRKIAPLSPRSTTSSRPILTRGSRRRSCNGSGSSTTTRRITPRRRSISRSRQGRQRERQSRLLVLPRRCAVQAREFRQAEVAYERYLQNATDPAAKVKTLLALGATKIAAHKADDAQRIAEEIMSLQPEGRVNAEARLLAGDVQLERGHFDEAGRRSWASHCFTTIRQSLRAPCRKPRRRIRKPASKRKPIARRNSSREVSRVRQRLAEASTFGH